jgi:hypothetical protein
MDPIRIRICQIFDFGSIVSIAGLDVETKAPLVVHVDHRPLKTIWTAWRGLELPQPVLYRAERLSLSLELQTHEVGR